MLGAILLLEIACQLLVFVNVAELWECGVLGISVARGALWDRKESQTPGNAFQGRSACARILSLAGQGSLLCGSMVAFSPTVVIESWGSGPDLSLSANTLGIKG